MKLWTANRGTLSSINGLSVERMRYKDNESPMLDEISSGSQSSPFVRYIHV
jgi:hypothetical protein